MSKIDIFNSDRVDKIVTNTLNGCDDGELYVEENLSENFNFDDNVLKSTSYNESKGFGLRAVNEDLIGYAHSSNIDIKALQEASSTVSSVKNGHSGEKLLIPLKLIISYIQIKTL